MVIDASLFEAFEKMPLPHIEFLDDSNLAINVLFSGFMGGAIGTLLYTIISELIRFFNE